MSVIIDAVRDNIAELEPDMERARVFLMGLSDEQSVTLCRLISQSVESELWELRAMAKLANIGLGHVAMSIAPAPTAKETMKP